MEVLVEPVPVMAFQIVAGWPDLPAALMIAVFKRKLEGLWCVIFPHNTQNHHLLNEPRKHKKPLKLAVHVQNRTRLQANLVITMTISIWTRLTVTKLGA